MKIAHAHLRLEILRKKQRDIRAEMALIRSDIPKQGKDPDNRIFILERNKEIYKLFKFGITAIELIIIYELSLVRIKQVINTAQSRVHLK